MKPEAEDVAQEVALQRLLGRTVNPRIVRARMYRAEVRRKAAELSHARVAPGLDVDAVQFPLLHAKFVLGLDGEELLSYTGVRSRSTLAARLRSEASEYLGETR